MRMRGDGKTTTEVWTTFQDDRLAAGLVPMENVETYPAWEFFPPGAKHDLHSHVLTVWDNGDGASAPFARKLLALLRSGALDA